MGIDGYDLKDLIHDLARFMFLLGADDGEELFGLDSTWTEHIALPGGMPSGRATTYKIRKP